jgi:hypothetical protein
MKIFLWRMKRIEKKVGMEPFYSQLSNPKKKKKGAPKNDVSSKYWIDSFGTITIPVLPGFADQFYMKLPYKICPWQTLLPGSWEVSKESKKCRVTDPQSSFPDWEKSCILIGIGIYSFFRPISSSSILCIYSTKSTLSTRNILLKVNN